MNHVSKLLLVTVTAAAVASAGTVIAYAGWPVPSKTAKVKVRAVDMPRGVQPSVARSAANAVVTWSPQEIGPGATMQSYLVRRHSADDAATVKEFPPVAATTFTDTAVPTGRWYWTVTPTFARWTGAESKKSANLKFTAATAPELPALVANNSVADSPAAPAIPANPDGGSPVISPAPGGSAKPPAAAEPEAADPPPPATEESTPVGSAPPSTGPVDGAR